MLMICQHTESVSDKTLFLPIKLLPAVRAVIHLSDVFHTAHESICIHYTVTFTLLAIKMLL